jgi:hypothetical protein
VLATGLSEGHRRAAAIFHRDYRYLNGISVSEACLLCHGTGRAARGELTSLAEGARVPTFDPHGSHPTGIDVRPGRRKAGSRILRNIDPKLELVGGRIECITCHSLTAQTPYRLVEFETRENLCRSCHGID